MIDDIDKVEHIGLDMPQNDAEILVNSDRAIRGTRSAFNGEAIELKVLADAFVVRMTLVPAVMALLGRRAWWMPKRLERIVPDVDIEGEAVMKGLHGATS